MYLRRLRSAAPGGLFLPVAALLLGGIAAGMASGQTSPRPKKAPAGLTGEAVLEKSIAAAGGRAVLEQVKTMNSQGTVSMSGPNFSLTGTVESYYKAPDKLYASQNLTLTAGGNTQQLNSVTVVSGSRGWIREPRQKAREMTAKERDAVLLQSDPKAALRWKQQYAKVELLGIRTVEKKDAYAVRLTPKSGEKPRIQYFDVKTFLPVRLDILQETPQGVIPLELYFGKFTTVEGLKTPSRIRQLVAANEVVIEYSSVRINRPIPDSKFSRPDD